MPQVDHYDVLHIDPSASADEVKQSWRKEILANHPDRGGDRLLFEAIQEAYACLSDPASRAAYDSERSNQNRQPPPKGSRAATNPHTRTGPAPTVQRVSFNDVAPQTNQKPRTGLLYQFADGTSVSLSQKNSFGAFVPTEYQRKVYRMGPAFVYKRLRPRDRIWCIAPPLPPLPAQLAKDPRVRLATFTSAVLSGPRWFRPRLTWIAMLVLWLAAPLAILSAMVSPPLSSWQLAAAVALPVWWPLPRFISAVWASRSGWLSSPVTAGALALLATGLPTTTTSIVVWVTALAVSFPIVVLLRRLRRVAPVFFTTRFS